MGVRVTDYVRMRIAARLENAAWFAVMKEEYRKKPKAYVMFPTNSGRQQAFTRNLGERDRIDHKTVIVKHNGSMRKGW